MNPKLKEAALYALRSGDYKQGQGAYFLGGLYDAVGAIIAEAVKQGLAPGLQLVDGVPNVPYDPKRITHAPWGTAAVAIGLPPSIQFAIINMNDGRKSFAEIADWLEETQ